VPAGWTRTTANPAPITLGLADTPTGIDFGNFKNVTLTGSKFNDLNGNGALDKGEPALSGFVFDLINAATSAVVATATSNASGVFSFSSVGPLPGGGNYLIREEPQTGWVQTTANPAAFAPNSGTNQTGFQFGNFMTYSIAGMAYIDLNGDAVRDGSDHGAAGFVIQIRNGTTVVASTTTAADGTYSFAAVGPGNFTLVEAPRGGFSVTQGASGYAIVGQSGTNLTGDDFGNVSRSIIVTSEDVGGPPTVTVRDAATQRVISTFNAYTSGFSGGVRIATGYFNSGALPNIVTAAGPGGGPHIKVLNAVDGSVVAQFFAYDSSFTGGVYVAVGDVNGDGTPDIITGADAGGGPHVKVFDGAALMNGQVKTLYSFFAYGASFHGGVRVAAGNIDGDKDADIITGAGAGGGPHVEAFSGQTGQLIRSFFAYAPTFTAGVYVAAGDVNGDGISDIVTGPGVGGGPHLRVFNGATNGGLIEVAFAFPPSTTGQFNNIWTSGLRVATADVNLDGRADIIVGPGTGQSPRIRVLDSLTLTDLLPGGQLGVFDPGFLGGVFVAGS
jgi:hypothetical protein